MMVNGFGTFVGPESGIQFSTNNIPTPPFNYANWGGIEPNNNKANEDYLMMNVGSDFSGIRLGQWADAAPDPNPLDPVIGYIVEYEPPFIRLSIMLNAAANTVQITFPTETNNTYRVQSIDQITSTNWINLGSSVSGNGGNQTIQDTVLNNAQRFYRLRILTGF